MLFTSFEFLILFLPIVFLLYYLFPIKARNYYLLIASLLFYAWGDPRSIIILLFSILLNYLLALRIIELEGKPCLKKTVFVIGILFNTGLLFVFKYLSFIVDSFVKWFPSLSDQLSVAILMVPAGISFFTFKAISYLTDVYRGIIDPEHNIGFFAMYLSFFPQLLAGPIGRYVTIKEEIRNREVTISSFSKGVVRFMLGFNKKILLANVLGELADLAFSINNLSIGMSWLGAIAYTLQIYFDFSGYSDMAIGLGKMLGFTTPENFDYPYISKTITDFWRRWHISLGSWFRDYVYFPLGGSRVNTKVRLILNLFAVWCLTGVWHGANWTFVIWGLFFGVLITIEKLADIPKRIIVCTNWKKFMFHTLTMLLVVFGWVLFRSDSLDAAWFYIKTMVGLSGASFVDNYFVFYSREYIVYLLAGIVFSLPVGKWVFLRFKLKEKKISSYLFYSFEIIQLILFVISISCMVLKTNNPFIYFNF